MAGKKVFPLTIAFRAVDKVTKPVLRIRKFIDGINSSIHEKIGRRLGVLRHKLKRLSEAAGVPALAKRFRAVGSSVRNVAREAANLARRLATIGLVGAGIALGLAKKFSSTADKISKVSSKLGVGTSKLQEWRYAAQLAGIAQQTFDMALQRFGRRAAEAAKGTGEALGVFTEMGVQLTDSAGKARPIAELLPEVADKLAGVSTAGERLRMAFKLFDSEGVAMVVMLEGGSEGLAKMSAEAHKLGVVISDEAIRAAVDFEDAQTKLRFSLFGLGGVLAESVLPELTKLVDRLREFAREHGPEIREWAENFAKKLPERLRKLKEGAKAFWEKLKPLRELATSLTEKFGAMNVVLGVLAVLFGTKLIIAIGAAVIAIRGLGVALLTTPIGLIITAIAALITIGYLLGKNWDKVKAWLIAGWERLQKKVGEVWGWIKDKIQGVTEWAGSKITGAWKGIGDFFGGLWDGIKNKFSSGVAWIREKVNAITGLVPDWMKRFVGIETGPSGAPIGPLSAAASAPQEVRAGGSIRVSFDGLPPGARVQQEEGGDFPVDLDLGYMMGRPA